MFSSNFSNPQIKAARIIVAREGWVVPSRVEPLQALVGRLKLDAEVVAMAEKLAACGHALKRLEDDKRKLAKSLAAIRKTAGSNDYAGTVKALGMAENALTIFPGSDELSRLSSFLESKLLLNSF